MEGMPRPNVKHAGVAYFYLFLWMTSIVSLVGVAVFYQFFNGHVHLIPEHAPAELLHHHLLAKVSMMGNVEDVCPL